MKAGLSDGLSGSTTSSTDATGSSAESASTDSSDSVAADTVSFVHSSANEKFTAEGEDENKYAQGRLLYQVIVGSGVLRVRVSVLIR